MKDPFKKLTMKQLGDVAMPVLVDRAGGSVIVTEADVVALAGRFGGRVAVKAEQLEPGVFRLTLVAATPRPEPLLD